MAYAFNADAVSLNELYRKYTSFEIPNFQRDYSWNVQYYANFFDDIINSIELDDQKHVINNYFIGTMVFSEAGLEKVQVIDGQQRLTTLTILISALARRLGEIPDDKKARGLFKYVSVEDIEGDVRPRLITTSSSPFLDKYVQTFGYEKSKSTITADTNEEELIQKAYDHFYEWLSDDNLNKYVTLSNLKYGERLIALRDQLMNIRMISIISKNKETSYSVFEILNAKGMQLDDLDLIKNYIFEKLNSDPDSVSANQKIVFNNWETMKKNLRDRDNNFDVSLFYRTYWISKFEKVPKNNLFKSFGRFFEGKEEDDYVEFSNDLTAESQRIIKIIKPRLSDYESKQQYLPIVQGLQNLSVLNTKQYLVILLALVDAYEKGNLSSRILIKTINFIETFIFMYSTLKHGQANIYESIFSKAAIEIRKSESKADVHSVLDKELFKNVRLRSEISTFEEFAKGFMTLEYTKRKTAKNATAYYALKKLTDRMNGDVIAQDFSVEHIVNEASKGDNVLNIGNLIGLERNLNSDADDKSFEDKRVIYEKSRYKQVKAFLDKYKKFEDDKIMERSKLIAKLYYDKIVVPDLLID